MSLTEERFVDELAVTSSLPYLQHLPPGYDESQPWPLVLFLHGMGERGDDLSMLKIYGMPKVVEENPGFPAIVIAPQCPADSYWLIELHGVVALLDHVQQTLAVDPDRVYLTGLSMGGHAAWWLAHRYPDRFAALVPICGWGDPNLVCRHKHMPTWIFHGMKDEVVPFQRSEALYEALKQCNGNVQFTAYRDVDHNSWDPAYATADLFEWMLAQRRQPDDN